jgi:hypothetical protein
MLCALNRQLTANNAIDIDIFSYFLILLFLIIIMGKQHGTLAKAGKVRKQTPKVAKA